MATTWLVVSGPVHVWFYQLLTQISSENKRILWEKCLAYTCLAERIHPGKLGTPAIWGRKETGGSSFSSVLSHSQHWEPSFLGRYGIKILSYFQRLSRDCLTLSTMDSKHICSNNKQWKQDLPMSGREVIRTQLISAWVVWKTLEHFKLCDLFIPLFPGFYYFFPFSDKPFQISLIIMQS